VPAPLPDHPNPLGHTSERKAPETRGPDDRIRSVRTWRKWTVAMIIAYGLFLVVVGVTTGPGNVGLTVVVILFGLAIAAAGGLLRRRWLRGAG
jgi:hypothetical protein